MSISRRLALPAAAAIAVALAAGAAPASGSSAATPPPAPTRLTGALAEEATRPLPEQAQLGTYTAKGATMRRVFKGGGRVAALKGTRDVPSRFSRAELARVQAALSAARTSSSAYGFYYDPASDSVHVDGRVDRARLPKRDLASGAVRVTATTGGQRVGLDRYHDAPPLRGGAAIYNQANGARCTSGIPVRLANGTRGMVTAAHCGLIGDRFVTGTAFEGVLTRRPSFPKWDLALLTGGTYGSQYWMGGRTGVRVPGGSAYTLRPGVGYCTSGSTTYEQCGKQVVSTYASFCDASGCTPGLVTLKGGVAPGPGDSGGPVVIHSGGKAWPRGVIIAVNNGVTYAHNWPTVAALFGATPIT
ncbi:MAG: S1 family peptidase [Micrococcales bacterium]|nr:S1 family peptidase [Micrococcales bacterium]